MSPTKSRKKKRKTEVMEEDGAIVAQGVTLAQLKAKAARSSYSTNKAIMNAIITQLEAEDCPPDCTMYVAFGMSGGGHGGLK